MDRNRSIQYFDELFQHQLRNAELRLNPFEQTALAYLHGRVLDYGCGLGNLAVAAAQKGCSVLALDASHTAVEHVRQIAHAQSLPINVAQADLRFHQLSEEFDAVVCIGLLMFFDCPTAFTQLQHLQLHVRPGGVAIVNVLVEGTTYLDMFNPTEHCLFSRDEMHKRFAGWDILYSAYRDSAAPQDQVKSFVTLVARKPLAGAG